MKVDCVVKLNSYVICEMAQNAHMNHDLREIGSWLMIDPPGFTTLLTLTPIIQAIIVYKYVTFCR